MGDTANATFFLTLKCAVKVADKQKGNFQACIQKDGVSASKKKTIEIITESLRFRRTANVDDGQRHGCNL
jgi:hypothetical protein